MPDGPVLLRRFPDLISADIAVSALADASIDAMIMSDDVGGTIPAMHAVRGVKVYVAADTEEAARRILDSMDDAPPLEGGDDFDEDSAPPAEGISES